MKMEVRNIIGEIEIPAPTHDEVLQYAETRLQKAMRETMDFVAVLLKITERKPLARSKRLKVEAINSAHTKSKIKIPSLTLSGAWLREAGFECRDFTRVYMINGLLVISPEDFDYSDMRRQLAGQ